MPVFQGRASGLRQAERVANGMESKREKIRSREYCATVEQDLWQRWLLPSSRFLEIPDYGVRWKTAVFLSGSGLAICSGFAITLALTSLPPLIVKTTALSENFGLITISPALAVSAGVLSPSLPPVITKTTSLSGAFGRITISPALAAPKIAGHAAAMTANDRIFRRLTLLMTAEDLRTTARTGQGLAMWHAIADPL